MANEHSQAHLDALAQDRGFPSYAAWSAGNAKYRKPITGTGQPQQPTNWLQNLANKIPIHPSYIFNYVHDKIAAATGKE